MNPAEFCINCNKMKHTQEMKRLQLENDNLKKELEATLRVLNKFQ